MKTCKTCEHFRETHSLYPSNFEPKLESKLGFCGRPGVKYGGWTTTTTTMDCDLWRLKDTKPDKVVIRVTRGDG